MTIIRSLAIAIATVAIPQSAVAQQQPIRPVISTTMQRVCQAETTATVLVREGTPVSDPMPAMERQERRLAARGTSDGYVFEHVTRAPAGTITFVITTSPAGVVKDAEMTGIPAELGMPAAQQTQLARTSADDLPERLLIGRTFAVGDSYYPEPLRQNLISRVMDSLGMPFPVQGSIDVLYRGEVEHNGRRAWLFDGDMTVSGSGEAAGSVVGLRQSGTGRVLHDVETGLVLHYELKMQNHINVDGKDVTVMKATNVWQCEIVPQ